MAQVVIVESILAATRRGSIFNARDDQGDRHRFVGGEAMPRVPVPGEAWQIGGTIRSHVRYGRQVHVEAARLIRPSGRLLVGLLSGPRFPGIGPVTAGILWDRHGENLYGILDRGDQAVILDTLGNSLRARDQAMVLLERFPDSLNRKGFP